MFVATTYSGLKSGREYQIREEKEEEQEQEKEKEKRQQ
jgi:hypothetical protein